MNEYNELDNHPLLLLYDFPVVVNPPDLDFLVDTDGNYLINTEDEFLIDN